MKYGEAVNYMGKTFLSGKDQTLEDYIAYMKEPGNKADELSLHLCACMCQKQAAVVTKTNIYYTGKLNNSCNDFIQILDCDMVLVYLGKGVFRGTKEKPFLNRPEPKRAVPRPEMDDEYVPPVYEQESLPSKHFIWSMGSVPLAESPPHTTPEPSHTEAASDSSPAPPTKRQGCSKRWSKQIIVKEKVYKIRRGSQHCCKQCTLCHKYFESQKELNDHTSDVHSFCFLCPRQSCGKDFISQASLDNIY